MVRKRTEKLMERFVGVRRMESSNYSGDK